MISSLARRAWASFERCGLRSPLRLNGLHAELEISIHSMNNWKEIVAFIQYRQARMHYIFSGDKGKL